MGQRQPDDHWWLEADEQILHEQHTSGRYQYADSIVRRRLPATFFLTDRRLTASRARGRAEQRKLLPMDVPLDKLQSFSVQYELRSQSAYYRPFPGRRVLRLEIDHKRQLLVFGIVLKTETANRWLATLAELRPDIDIPDQLDRRI